MQPRIVIDLSPLTLPACGIRRSVAGLLSELPACCGEAGIRLEAFAYRSRQPPALPCPHLPLTHLPLTRRDDPLIAAQGLIEQGTGPALFHATDFYLPLHPGSAMIATIHDVIYAVAPEHTPEQRAVAQAMSRHLPQAVRAICCSRHSAESFCQHYGYPAAQVDIVPWGIDSKLFRPAPPGQAVSGEAPYFLAVSCNETRKNTPRLLRAFIRYALSGGGYALRLAWQLPPALRAEVAAAGLSGRVQELGTVDDGQLVALYRGAACLLFPSLHEGFGFPVLEALACGTPVMTTRRSALPEVGGDLALYVDGSDITEMAGCLHALAQGQCAAQVRRCRLEGPAWAGRFSWRRCAEQTVLSYLRALPRSRRAG